MARPAKPAKGKPDAKQPPARKSPKHEDSRVRELEKRLAEGLEREKATGEILRVISSSPTDAQPVFDAILSSALRLCDGLYGTIFMERNGQIVLEALTNISDEARAVFQRVYPTPLNSPGIVSSAIREGVVLHVPDVSTYPSARGHAARLGEVTGYRCLLVIPLIKQGHPIGALALARAQPEPFSAEQVTLVQAFADQAVIAIENVRLFNETKEALERQTATSAILSVIASSPTDVQPVYDAIVRSAAALCEATLATVYRRDGDLVHLVGVQHQHPYASDVAAAYPAPVTSSLMSCRAILENAVIHLPDVDAEGALPPDGLRLARLSGFRSVLSVPMRREGRSIGAILIGRPVLGRFPDEQITLLQTFASQAVIAIENVRLFKELEARNKDLTQSLEQQTATSDILKVIASSTTDLTPVFEAICRSAVRLFNAHGSSLRLFDGELVHLGANVSPNPDADERLRARFPHPPNPEWGPERPILDGTVIHIPDMEEDPTALNRQIARDFGYRRLVVVPMLHDGQIIGTIAVAGSEPGPYSTQQIELLKTFADQAVIAIENVRLLGELQVRTQELTRSVGQLTALGEVGRAVSSTLDLQTVLATIVGRAVELSGTSGGVIYEHDEATDELRLRASHQIEPELAEVLRGAPFRLGEGVTGRAAALRTPVQVQDLLTEREFALARISPIAERLGYRSVLAVPLLLEDRVMGGLTVWRKQPGDFAPDVVHLLQTFSAQSSLALQNARLFREIERKSHQLEAASQHKSEFLANMSHELRTPLNAIIGYSELLEEEAGDLDSGRLVPDLQKIGTAAKHQLSLINDILDLSKVEAGRMELEVTDFDLPSAIENALTFMRERGTRRRIVLGRMIDDRVGVIQGDERKVKQVLLNLLSNALKFTSEGGRIDVGATVSEGLVEVSVADTGTGIAPADQEAIFEEFRQVGTADKKVEGTGLGLALSRRFIELHGGRIWVKSELGRGSTFTFTLPVRHAE